MAGKIIRVTMFKLPSKESQQKMIGLYKTLSETARKVYLQLSPQPHPRLFTLWTDVSHVSNC
jgi:hypothetical protein